MPYILCYTKNGRDYQRIDKDGKNNIGLGCDLNHSMHLSISDDKKKFEKLRNGTGILFPEAIYDGEKIAGTTKNLLYPWLFRYKDGTFGVCAVRRNQYAPDTDSLGSIMIYQSENLINYKFKGFLELDNNEEIFNPKCKWLNSEQVYYLEWDTKSGKFSGESRTLNDMDKISRRSNNHFKSTSSESSDINTGNIIKISNTEAIDIKNSLGEIKHLEVRDEKIKLPKGKKIQFEDLPKATCIYSDDSIHKKKVLWNQKQFEKINFNKKGTYELDGVITQKQYSFPLLNEFTSDPSIKYYNGKYYFSSTGEKSINIRVSDSISGLFKSNPIEIYKIPENKQDCGNLWAPELHIIKGVPYIFTTVGKNKWYTVKSHVLRCVGNPSHPDDWEEPRLVVKPDGNELNPDGISLDMTYFTFENVHYVMWANRKVMNEGTVTGSSDLYIATINPNKPWELNTLPVCITRPLYGWNRIATEVVEGPYLVRHNDDLFVTISGGSTGYSDLYCVGLLHSKVGKNLLSAESWKLVPYPILTKESVENQKGPGHNSFFTDYETQDTYMVFHAVPDEMNAAITGRRPGIRRVHWKKDGTPYLEMTPERDLCKKKATLEINIY